MLKRGQAGCVEWSIRDWPPGEVVEDSVTAPHDFEVTGAMLGTGSFDPDRVQVAAFEISGYAQCLPMRLSTWVRAVRDMRARLQHWWRGERLLIRLVNAGDGPVSVSLQLRGRVLDLKR